MLHFSDLADKPGHGISRSSYPPTLNGDPNWVLVWGRMGSGQYLNVKFVTVDQVQGDYHVLSGEAVYATYTYHPSIDCYIWNEFTLGKKYEQTFVYNLKDRSIAYEVNGNWDSLRDPDRQPGYRTNGKAGLAQRMFWEAYHFKFFRTDYSLGGV